MNSETHIGQYKIVRTLGAGGMGTVYLGEHLLLGRRAAIKTLLPALSIHREIVDRFFNEARAISAISDPGVVQIFDFGYHVDGTAYIVMEFLEGENLASRLDRLGKLALLDSLRIARMIASSLHAAHERGIIHRDLKPGNVFVIRDNDAPGGERTKILDFGICKLQNESEASTTQTGVMLGTPVYMSPEQCRGGQVDARSDLYSVGCALFHMLTGRTPFDCESIGEFIACHLKDEPQPPSELDPSLPPAVDALVLRCLEKNPEDRFQTMRDLQGALDDIIATLSDPGRQVTASHMNATPLAEGFRSGFDVNDRDSSSRATIGARPSRPSNPWFVDSLAPVAAASIGDDENEHAWVKPDRGMSLPARAALVLVLFSGLIGGIAATSAALSSGDGPASTATSTAPTTPGDLVLPPSEPATVAPRAIAPAHPIASGDGIEPELGTDDPAKSPTASPDEAPAITKDVDEEPPTQVEPPKKVERPPPNRKWHPQPRRHVEPEQPEAKPEEDLYDTR